MAGYKELVASLPEKEKCILLAIGVDARTTSNCDLGEQGQLLEKIQLMVTERFSETKAYRVLWNQLCFRIYSKKLPEILDRLLGVLDSVKSQNMMIRGIATEIDGGIPLASFENFLDEISASWNFGVKYEGSATRIIDGSIFVGNLSSPPKSSDRKRLS